MFHIKPETFSSKDFQIIWVTQPIRRGLVRSLLFYSLLGNIFLRPYHFFGILNLHLLFIFSEMLIFHAFMKNFNFKTLFKATLYAAIEV